MGWDNFDEALFGTGFFFDDDLPQNWVFANRINFPKQLCLRFAGNKHKIRPEVDCNNHWRRMFEKKLIQTRRLPDMNLPKKRGSSPAETDQHHFFQK